MSHNHPLVKKVIDNPSLLFTNSIYYHLINDIHFPKPLAELIFAYILTLEPIELGIEILDEKTKLMLKADIDTPAKLVDFIKEQKYYEGNCVMILCHPGEKPICLTIPKLSMNLREGISVHKTLVVPDQTLRDEGKQVLNKVIKSISWDSLFPKALEEYKNEIHAKLAIEEYQKFLTLKILIKDFQSEKLSPSENLDKIWHIHVESGDYKRDCELMCGEIICHTSIPFVEITMPRYLKTCQLYSKYFGSPLHDGDFALFDDVPMEWELTYTDDRIKPGSFVRIEPQYLSAGCG